MHVPLNILAVALMVVMPFLRPCACSGFTLFCDCRAAVATEHDGCCGSSCGLPTEEHDNPEQDLPEKSKPCGQLPVIEIGIGVQFIDSVSVSTADGFAWLQVASRSQFGGSFHPTFDYHPPPSIGLVVSQTQMLRI